MKPIKTNLRYEGSRVNQFKGMAIVTIALATSCLAFEFVSPPKDELYRGKAAGPENSGSVLILDVPFFPQEEEFYCSEASASMVLGYLGYSVSQGEVHRESDKFETMAPFLSRYVDCEPVWGLGIEALKREISQGDPVMVRILVGRYLHTVVVVGYGEECLYVHDPALGAFLRADQDALLRLWEPTGFAAIVLTRRAEVTP